MGTALLGRYHGTRGCSEYPLVVVFIHRSLSEDDVLRDSFMREHLQGESPVLEHGRLIVRFPSSRRDPLAVTSEM
jgi:hypothetical protein